MKNNFNLRPHRVLFDRETYRLLTWWAVHTSWGHFIWNAFIGALFINYFLSDHTVINAALTFISVSVLIGGIISFAYYADQSFSTCGMSGTLCFFLAHWCLTSGWWWLFCISVIIAWRLLSLRPYDKVCHASHFTGLGLGFWYSILSNF